MRIELPAFAEIEPGTFRSIDKIPEPTRANIIAFLDHMRNMEETDEIAFRTVVGRVAAIIQESQ